jgi:hypothetical protein
MESRYDLIHEAVLSVLHALLTGHFGLMGDALERLLRKWYFPEYAEAIEIVIKELSPGSTKAG